MLTFCIDSLEAENPWHQFISYYLTGKGGASAKDLKEILDDLLLRLKEAGVDVRLITCDQGANNRKLYSKYLKICNDNSTNWVPTYFCEKTQKKYYACFDFPHLIKRFIYALRTDHRIYNRQKKVVVDYKDLLNVYKMDYMNPVCEALPHLSWTHFLPNNFQCMNVKRAFQVLGGKLGAALHLVYDSPGIPNDKTTLGDSSVYVNKMNVVIDICNYKSEKSANVYKQPLSETTGESFDRLREIIQECKGWYTLTKKGKSTKPPCFHEIVMTLRGFLELYDDLARDFKSFRLATRYCNQDSVENFFSKVRQRGGNNTNPTARGC